MPVSLVRQRDEFARDSRSSARCRPEPRGPARLRHVPPLHTREQQRHVAQLQRGRADPSDPDAESVLPFLAAGAPDKARRMRLEVVARLPKGSRIWLDAPIAFVNAQRYRPPPIAWTRSSSAFASPSIRTGPTPSTSSSSRRKRGSQCVSSCGCPRARVACPARCTHASFTPGKRWAGSPGDWCRLRSAKPVQAAPVFASVSLAPDDGARVPPSPSHCWSSAFCASFATRRLP